MGYSLDFRKKVMLVRMKEGLSLAATAQRYGVGKNTVFLWSKRLEPKLKRNKPWTKIKKEELLQDIKDYSDAYAYERARRLGVSTTGVYKALKRLNIR